MDAGLEYQRMQSAVAAVWDQRPPAFCASVAHEISQPLAAIVCDASACRRWLAAPTPNLKRVEVIMERVLSNAQSVAEIIDSLRALFVSDGKSARVLASVNDLIREACTLLEGELAARQVKLTLQLDPVLPTVTLERTLVRQLLINLIRNAAEAMETSQGRRRLEVRSRYHRGEVRVEVCDEGSGVTNVAHMFDAPFTTKPKGMGMGLTICRQIVEAHGGRLWMEPQKSRGTRMTFTLPIRAPLADRTGDA